MFWRGGETLAHRHEEKTGLPARPEPWYDPLEEGPGTNDEARKPSMEMRIALIGIAGALAGTLAGGLVTWAVTKDQLASQRADARRTERLTAYSQYFGDAASLWTQVFDIYEVSPRPPSLTRAQTAGLRKLEERLTREYALVALLAPDHLRSLARELNNADTDVGNALGTDPIDYEGYKEAMKQVVGPNSLLRQFTDAAKKDIGTR